MLFEFALSLIVKATCLTLFYLLCICVIVHHVHVQIWSQGFPLGSDYEAGGGGDKPELRTFAQSHFRVWNLWFVCISSDWSKGSSGCVKWSGWGRLFHMQCFFSTSCPDRRIWFCSVHCGFENPAAIQNPNGDSSNFLSELPPNVDILLHGLLLFFSYTD